MHFPDYRVRTDPADPKAALSILARRTVMARANHTGQQNLSRQVLAIVRRKRKCNLDDLIKECSSHTWTQVFLEVDHLSRSGQLCIFCKKAGDYTLTLPHAASSSHSKVA
jgi:hypothetical protein